MTMGILFIRTAVISRVLVCVMLALRESAETILKIKTKHVSRQTI